LLFGWVYRQKCFLIGNKSIRNYILFNLLLLILTHFFLVALGHTTFCLFIILIYSMSPYLQHLTILFNTFINRFSFLNHFSFNIRLFDNLLDFRVFIFFGLFLQFFWSLFANFPLNLKFFFIDDKRVKFKIMKILILRLFAIAFIVLTFIQFLLLYNKVL